MHLLDSFIEGGMELPEKDRKDYFYALVVYMATGAVPKVSAIAKAMITANKPALDKSRARSISGSEGGKKRQANSKQTRSKTRESDEANAKQNAVDADESGEANTPISGKGIGIGIGIDNPDGLSEPPYPLSCLAALNDELRGLCDEFTRNPHVRFLAGFEDSVPIEDVRRMVRYKRGEWEGTRFQANLTPSTLFSPDHFEAYLAQSKMPPPTKGVTVDDELRSYDG